MSTAPIWAGPRFLDDCCTDPPPCTCRSITEHPCRHSPYGNTTSLKHFTDSPSELNNHKPTRSSPPSDMSPLLPRQATLPKRAGCPSRRGLNGNSTSNWPIASQSCLNFTSYWLSMHKSQGVLLHTHWQSEAGRSSLFTSHSCSCCGVSCVIRVLNSCHPKTLPRPWASDPALLTIRAFFKTSRPVRSF